MSCECGIVPNAAWLTMRLLQMQGRGRSDQNRRPSTGGRGGPARGTGPPSSSSNNSINAGRSSGRGGGRPSSSRGPAPPQAPPPDTAPPPGLPGPPRLGPLPEATQQASTAIANGPSTTSGEARNVRQGRPSQEGPARGSKQPGGRSTRAQQSGPGRGRGAGGNMPRTASDKAGIPPAHAAGGHMHIYGASSPFDHASMRQCIVVRQGCKAVQHYPSSHQA